jgi:LPPG:FO 2-phospho-L-lactate transferase
VRLCVLSGGVGGARLVRGLAEVCAPEDVTVVGNVGDDLEVLGLHVSPDLDSVLYALAGLADEERGWGRADETWHALETVEQLRGESWFRLGDRDLGLHLVRTQSLAAGEPLSAVTAQLAASLGIETTLLPATDDRLRTWVETPSGSFEFQEWFVARGHRDEVDAVRFEGAETARPAPGVLEAIATAELLLFAPSNPYVSIGPILAVHAIRHTLEQRSVPLVAVSPLIGGRSVKGPGDEMLRRLAGGTTPALVASCYPGLLDALVIDEADAAGADALAELGVRPVVTRTLMSDAAARARVVDAALGAAGALL